MQRQLRLGDILDDYCPRERRLTNHAVVAMVGDDVKQTRCTTCDAEHEYKHARVPRQRRKSEAPAALYAQVAAGAPKRVVHEPRPPSQDPEADAAVDPGEVEAPPFAAAPEEPPAQAETIPMNGDPLPAPQDQEEKDGGAGEPHDDGSVHRRLIRAQLPRIEGQPPPPRQAPEFTIRQPGGRPGRFRPRHHQRGGQGGGQGFGNRSNGNAVGGPMRSGRPGGGQHQPKSRPGRPHGSGRKRSR
jgi:hypothetical protein